MNDKRTCGSCRHYFTGNGRSWCRRYPPFPEDRRHSRFPTVMWDDNCGEWKQKPKGK